MSNLTEDEFNLSQKRWEDTDNGVNIYAYSEEDVIKLIKRLKEEIGINRYLSDHKKVIDSEKMVEIINKLAGDKLIGEKGK